MLKIPNRLIVIPDLLVDYISDSFVLLAKMFAKILNAQIITYSKYNPCKKAEIVISLGAPSRAFEGNKFWNAKTKLFIYWIDDMGWSDESRKKDFQKTIERADLILCVNLVKFSLLWEKYIERIIYFPFYAPDYFLNEAINPNPLMKCLLSGRMKIGENKSVYPIRQKVLKSKMQEIEILPHPSTTNKIYQKQDFAKEIKKYFCCVTDSSRIYYDFIQKEKTDLLFSDVEKAKSQGQIVKKYFEIPATGSILLADGNTKEEMNILGFQNEVNFIQIDENNVLDIISEVLKNPEKYEHIREEGVKFIKKNHLLIHREKLFDQIMSAYIQ